MPLTLQQLERHLFKAADILRGKMDASDSGKLHDRLSIEADELSKLQHTKLGLMDDLLTGRVRVTPLLKSGVST